jgi:polysaccharide deacetylase family protein (PEP-CTERM system associated)
MLNAFTIDVEDYFHVSAFAERIPARDWDHFSPRAQIGTYRLLSLLDRHQVRATFFVLGWLAERQPELVRAIHAAGHEIACHSYQHRLVYQMTPDEFRDDLVRAKDVLEQTIGAPVQGYRAPSFSIVRRSLWALDILADEGIRFDSSIYPIRHDRYGIPDGRVGPHLVSGLRSDRALWEFPGTVATVGKWRLPVGGGGYFRLYPYRVSAALLRRANGSARLPFMFYIHPWELDPDQPRLQVPWLRGVRHRMNLASTESRLERLLAEFRFGTMSDVLAGLSGAAESRHVADTAEESLGAVPVEAASEGAGG